MNIINIVRRIPCQRFKCYDKSLCFRTKLLLLSLRYVFNAQLSICQEKDNNTLVSNVAFLRKNKEEISHCLQKVQNLINAERAEPVKKMSYNIVHLTNPETSNYSYLGSTVSIFEYKYPLAASLLLYQHHIVLLLNVTKNVLFSLRCALLLIIICYCCTIFLFHHHSTRSLGPG